jgi:broad specificity phosphatase PhoE
MRVYTVRHALSVNNIEQRRKMLLPGLIDLACRKGNPRLALALTQCLDALRLKRSKYPLPDSEVALAKASFNQAYITGKALPEHGIRPELLISSPFLRTRQTAGMIRKGYFEATGRTLEIDYLDCLVERSAGDLFGYPFEYYRHLFPGPAEEYKRVSSLKYRPPNGESKLDVWHRINDNLAGILSTYWDRSVLIVAHECVNLCLHSIFTGASFAEIEESNIKIPNLGIYGYERTETGGWKVAEKLNGRTILAP